MFYICIAKANKHNAKIIIKHEKNERDTKMEQKKWNICEKQQEFKSRRRSICKDYDDEVRQLKRELSAKVDRLKLERDKKLDAVSLEQARYEDSYRQWKIENNMVPEIIEEKQ